MLNWIYILVTIMLSHTQAVAGRDTLKQKMLSSK